ncbi:MAG: VOC family protein [Burkholderiaceae bacterium]
MHKQIFVNLPIKDMARSQAFFRALGYDFNPQFTNEQGASLVLGENLFAMLLVEPFFQGFVKHKAVADAKTSAQVLVCLSCDSRAEVDALVARALAAGGTAPNAPQDHGFMYAHGFEDLDGHGWELVHMDASAAANPTRDA